MFSAIRLSPKKKPWGKTYPIFYSDQIEIWHAEICRGESSSLHRHVWKANDFYVVAGSLLLKIEGQDDVELNQGELITIPPGVRHQFTALENTTLIETYWITKRIDPDDIERENECDLLASSRLV